MTDKGKDSQGASQAGDSRAEDSRATDDRAKDSRAGGGRAKDSRARAGQADGGRATNSRPTPLAPQTSLARGVAPACPGTLHARSVTGAVRVTPRPGLTVAFGRGELPEVALAVGEHDLMVSRRHGELTYRGHQWWLRNTGQQLVRLPRGRMLHASTDPVPLATGYTPLFVRGSGYREHLVELYVSGPDDPGPVARRGAETLPPRRWSLDDDERLLLVVLGQEYLLYEEGPRPLTYSRAAQQLAYLRPGKNWNERRIEYRVEAVRRRLHDSGFPHPLLHDNSVGRPSDNSLLHNLLRGLVESTTLVPPDLCLMDDDGEEGGTSTGEGGTADVRGVD
ncbi:FHA domain-containing protein [Streptomyces alboflavus]|uniref:FHA domain-containing protein n=1 Tax=Streptomyces alboflavus TaxID=67267 RepID=UPI00367CF368